MPVKHCRKYQRPATSLAPCCHGDASGKGGSNGSHIQINRYYMKLHVSVNGSNYSPPGRRYKLATAVFEIKYVWWKHFCDGKKCIPFYWQLNEVGKTRQCLVFCKTLSMFFIILNLSRLDASCWTCCIVFARICKDEKVKSATEFSIFHVFIYIVALSLTIKRELKIDICFLLSDCGIRLLKTQCLKSLSEKIVGQQLLTGATLHSC